MSKRKASEELNSKEKDKFRQTTFNELNSDAYKKEKQRNDEFQSFQDVGNQFLDMAANQLSIHHGVRVLRLLGRSHGKRLAE